MPTQTGARKMQVVIQDGEKVRTYEGRVSTTPKGLHVLHVSGPQEYHRSRQMHHVLNLTEWSWCSTPDAPAIGAGTSRRGEFVEAGRTMADEWADR